MKRAGICEQIDAVVVGAGPNGLAAAIEVARAGRRVIVFESEESVGGGARTAELTLPGFLHDICSAVYPLAAASPFFRSLGLERHGLRWIESPAALAHPIGGDAVVLRRAVAETAEQFGVDRAAYHSLMGPLVHDWPRVERAVMGPLTWPRHPLTQARFGWKAVRSASWTARKRFVSEPARALFAGLAAHGMLALSEPLTAGIGLTLGTLAHVAGWPIPRGGAQAISDALAGCLRSLGGEIVTGACVRSLDELPRSKVVFLDLSPKPLLQMTGGRFPAWYRKSLENYRYGAGAFKMDWALNGPIPWKSALCAQAATVHLGGGLDEIEFSEDEVAAGKPPQAPFVILAQPSLFDDSRAPRGKHVAWAYCHVPNGSDADMAGRIELQIETFAPGFGARILARNVMAPSAIERHNSNMAGGDIGAGAVDWRQFIARPNFSLYSTPARGIYHCSAATPPGVGVHGMCGYFAARRALRREFG
jgi:phytoene dehydrogenase-like protein